MTHVLYDALELPKTATEDDVKKAYKRLAKVHHPDKGGDAERFKAIAKAYEVLSDPEKRAAYDQLGDEGFNESGGANAGPSPDDLFAHMFGHAFGGFGPFGGGGMPRPASRACADHQYRLSVSLDEAYDGLEKTIRVKLDKRCFACWTTCGTCKGEGAIQVAQRVGPMTMVNTLPCEDCRGRGGKNSSCARCTNGNIMEEVQKTITLPRGVMTGMNVTIPGLGQQPQKQGDRPGDLLVTVEVRPHAAFERKGNDLVFGTPITMADAVLGRKLVVPHFSGDIEIDTSRFGIVRPGQPYQVTGKGMPLGLLPPGTDAGVRYGNLYIMFDWLYPTVPSKGWSAEQRQAWQAAFDAAGIK